MVEPVPADMAEKATEAGGRRPVGLLSPITVTALGFADATGALPQPHNFGLLGVTGIAAGPVAMGDWLVGTLGTVSADGAP